MAEDNQAGFAPVAGAINTDYDVNMTPQPPTPAEQNGEPSSPHPSTIVELDTGRIVSETV